MTSTPGDFAVETYQINGTTLDVRVSRDGSALLLTQDELATLYGKDRSVITKHIQNIFEEGELEREGNVQKMHITPDGRPTNVYSLDVALSVGYRVSSAKATKFRQWSTSVLRSYVERGFVLDADRMARDPEVYRELAHAIRQIRTSERNMYDKVKDVFKFASSDYDKNSKITKSFYAMVQDKFHYAVTQKTAAQILMERADASKPNMGLSNTERAVAVPSFGHAKVAKNYLDENELHALENLCEQWLLFAESKAFRDQKMTMEELSFKLNTLLTVNDYPVLYEYPDTSSRTRADQHVKQQIAKYKSLQAPTKKKAIGSGR
jgi:hypothetical protein